MFQTVDELVDESDRRRALELDSLESNQAADKHSLVSDGLLHLPLNTD